MLSQLISVCNSERIIKTGQYLPKICSNKKGPVFGLIVYIYSTIEVANPNSASYKQLPSIGLSVGPCFISHESLANSV